MSSPFCHLHCHTTYSLLDGAANVKDLIKQAKVLGMDSLAISDHGTMSGVVTFVNTAQQEGVKPIIGCELYVAADMHARDDKRRYHQLLLAKNQVGYTNLMKLCSLGYTEGYYYKPRVDRKTIKQYAEGLIATTCCLASEVQQAILKQGEAAAEEVFLAWLDIFGEDYYIELQRHGIKEQEVCNRVLLQWAKKYGVKVIATNDVHYLKKEDSLAHDIMLCLQTGKRYHDKERMRFMGEEFYLKSPEEMMTLFTDVPEAISNTLEIANKVELFSLERDLLMPNFDIPAAFANQGAYLKHLTFEGAKKRYGKIDSQLKARIDHELEVILSMGFAGYFLIVQDVVIAAKKRGVCVGAGRGSVAGSVVAYALGITDVEPIQYRLLFERFLNPDRVSMPDIDIDFDDEGREQVIRYLADQYGKEQVAHINTFNTLGPKSAIRGVARVLDVPLHQADSLAKLVPNKLGTTLASAYQEVPEMNAYRKKPDSIEGKILTISEKLEGVESHVGIHAAGIIIADRPIIDVVPIRIDKNTNLLVTQYDGSVIERVGMLKMDLLGLKTLSVIRDALRLIERVHGKKIDITQLPLDDAKTFALYQKGDTIATFQFESEGMREYLKQLKPTRLEHLIAMNALYRPGPMKNIPSYIRRMHGQERIEYLHPILKDILESTFGIPIYQEQIMQIAQKMAGYTLAQADLLRRAMGKKKKDEMERQEALFVEGAKKNGIDGKRAKEIFEVMSYFNNYGFNLAHAAAYTLIAWQTGYLKAHYPTAFMASCLIHNQKNMDKIKFLIEECQRMGINVEGPDINKSDVEFSSDRDKKIRFGLAAIKGLGKKDIELLIKEREANGSYASFSDMIQRLIGVNQGKAPGKKLLETLAMTGAFDCFDDLHRRQYVYAEKDQVTFIEQMIKYQQKLYNKQVASQQFLFAIQPVRTNLAPKAPSCDPYTSLEKLKMEKELVGFYMTGHPLDPFQTELRHLCNAHTQTIMHKGLQQSIRLAGMVLGMTHRQNSKGSGFGILTVEDYKGSVDIMLFGEEYSRYRHILKPDEFVYIKGVLKQRRGYENSFVFRTQGIEPLDSALEKNTQKVQIHLPLERIDTAFVDSFVELCEKYEGNCTIQIILPHAETKSMVKADVNRYRITPSKWFFHALEKQAIPFTVQCA